MRCILYLCNEIFEFKMTIDSTDYEKLKPFLKIIKHVATGGNTSNGDAWWMLYQIKLDKTGFTSRSDCDSCKVELFQEFQRYIEEYETMEEILKQLSIMKSSPNTCILQSPSVYKEQPIDNFYCVSFREFGFDFIKRIVEDINKMGLVCFAETLYCARSIVGIVVNTESAKKFFKVK